MDSIVPIRLTTPITDFVILAERLLITLYIAYIVTICCIHHVSNNTVCCYHVHERYIVCVYIQVYQVWNFVMILLHCVLLHMAYMYMC